MAPEPSPVHRFLRRIFVPWWTPDDEAAAARRSEDIRQRSIAARISAEQVRRDYTAMARRLDR